MDANAPSKLILDREHDVVLVINKKYIDFKEMSHLLAPCMIIGIG